MEGGIIQGVIVAGLLTSRNQKKTTDMRSTKSKLGWTLGGGNNHKDLEDQHPHSAVIWKNARAHISSYKAPSSRKPHLTHKQLAEIWAPKQPQKVQVAQSDTHLCGWNFPISKPQHASGKMPWQSRNLHHEDLLQQGVVARSRWWHVCVQIHQMEAEGTTQQRLSSLQLHSSRQRQGAEGFQKQNRTHLSSRDLGGRRRSSGWRKMRTHKLQRADCFNSFRVMRASSYDDLWFWFYFDFDALKDTQNRCAVRYSTQLVRMCVVKQYVCYMCLLSITPRTLICLIERWVVSCNRLLAQLWLGCPDQNFNGAI